MEAFRADIVIVIGTRMLKVVHGEDCAGLVQVTLSTLSYLPARIVSCTLFSSYLLF